MTDQRTKDMLEDGFHKVEVATLRDAAADADKQSRDRSKGILGRVMLRAMASWLRERADRREAEGPYRS